MQSHVRVAVIGGGIVGCSVLYHLTRLGWTDVVLIERKELTAGSSWHAAGGFHAINSDLNVARLQAYTVRSYREVQQMSGQDIGIHMTGGINVAATRERWEFLQAEHARHRVIGLETHLVGPEEIRRLCPIMDTRTVLGAIFDPNEGHLDPTGAALAYAEAARLGGAQVLRHTRVTQLQQLPDAGWLVVTDQGTLKAEHIVNAAGLWAREVGKMVGVDLPLLPMEHQYLVTDLLPDLTRLAKEIALTVDLDGEIYVRQEGKGVLLGVYEKAASPWAVQGTPWDYGEAELLPPNLDRIANELEKGFKRFPVLESVGIRRVVNGPITFTPDGNPLVGPLPGLRNYWVACGVMAGFSQAGGIGLALATWIVSGEPESDVFAMDVARFGSFATRSYVHARVREFYARRFQLAYPNEYWPAGRPSKTSALYDFALKGNAVHGVSFGLELPLFFAAPGTPPEETTTLRRSNAFECVSRECRAARASIGIADASAFAKYEVSGPRAAKWLDSLLASRLPPVGRIRLATMLSPKGRLMGDLTVARVADDHFMLFGSGYLQVWHMRWFQGHMPKSGVEIRNLSDEYAALLFIGPRSRELLASLSSDDVSTPAFPFMSVRVMEVGAVPATVARLSITGELGYEIYVPAVFGRCLGETVNRAAKDLGACNIGLYALNSLRLEKSYGIWSREFTSDYTPRMCGLWKIVDYEKDKFIGKAAAMEDRDHKSAHELVTLEIDAVDADAYGFEPVWHKGEYVGYTTSGGYGHCAGKSLAMGYVKSELLTGNVAIEVSIAGTRRAARVLQAPAIDPTGERMRL